MEVGVPTKQPNRKDRMATSQKGREALYLRTNTMRMMVPTTRNMTLKMNSTSLLIKQITTECSRRH